MTGEPGPAAAGVPEIIRAGTRLRPVPLVPEIRLWQASEPIDLWQRTEDAAGQAAGGPVQAAGSPGRAAGGPGPAGLDPPFWAFAWAGGQALARYLLDHPQTVRGRRVIDMASGSGLVAIAAARAGAAAVTGYDIDPLAAAAIAVNAAANGVTVTAVCADVLDGDGIPAPGADVVLVADAFYQRDLAARVLRFLDRVHAAGAGVLAGDFGRTYLPRARLVPVASYDVPGLRAVEDTDVKRTTVWTLAG
ncbi:MAG TPA: 50S ribosomal protein L11 methyltransferase [Streptosporangiaceae bacterium]|jgi:predicted nicotinamide N-methyase